MYNNSKYRAELIGSERIHNYIFGGHGVVTLQSDVSNEHHTYKFEAPEDRKQGDDLMFIHTLADNNLWLYVGMYRNGCFKLTKKSKFSKDTATIKGLAYIFKMILNDGYRDDRMHLMHEGVCSRCGRPLTNPASIELGIGPTCAKSI